MEWLKGQAELEGAEEVKDMVSVCKKRLESSGSYILVEKDVCV